MVERRMPPTRIVPALDEVEDAPLLHPLRAWRLVITPLGAGRFTVEVTRGADKWEIRA